MIRVVRRVEPAEPGAAAALLAQLDTTPGAWIGCDVDAEGMLRRHAHACVDPPLALYLDGTLLRVVPRTPLGHALLGEIAHEIEPLAPFTRVAGRLEVRLPGRAAAPHPVIDLLRRILALFAPASSELGWYGALAFDFYRLEHGDTLPDDSRRRLVLYLPDRVLRISGDRAEWVSFDFPDLVVDHGAQHAEIDAVHLERTDDDLAPGEHARRVERAVERLRRGDLMSLVLHQTFRRPTAVRPSQAFTLLRQHNPYPAMFSLNLGGGEAVFGASPDLQVQADAQWVETAPVCGTFRRGSDPYDDHAQARALLNSDKEEASLTVCADSDRTDKALVCEQGSVEHVARRRVHFFSTILHTIDFIRGRRRAGVDAWDIVLAHLTPPTVTGFPKPLAREAVAQIEGKPRGWYAGAAVRMGTDQSCEALTMLRFARVVQGTAEVPVGGALVIDADPQREEAETRLKAETLFRVLAGESPAPRTAPASAVTNAKVVVVDSGDPFAALVGEMLVQAGARLVDRERAEIEVHVGPIAVDVVAVDRRPRLLIGSAALATLSASGAPQVALPKPRFARALACEAASGSPLAARGAFDLASYATHTIDPAELPAGWTTWAVARDPAFGREEVAVAADAVHRCVAVLPRPEATHSARHGAGVWLLATALEWLRTQPRP